MKKTLVIAEAGVNHNGSLEMALELIDAAAAAKADIVKFQTFKTEQVISRFAPKAKYQIESTGKNESQFEMVKKLELGHEEHFTLLEHSKKRGIEFFSTAFDFESLEFLIENLKLKRIKIPSGEITNAPFILRMAQKGLPIILSTGMSTLEEVRTALGVLAFGYCRTDQKPSQEAFKASFLSEAGQKAIRQNITLLQCTTEYPTAPEDINLLAMKTMKDIFSVATGLSDHSQGINVALAAVALGAEIIEKHFTLDKSLPGPDHQASLDPKELKDLVTGIRTIEKALGSPEKKPAPSELKNIPIARKSLVAGSVIKSGEVFSASNIALKRPGSGLSPMLYWEYIGKIADKDYGIDELID